MRIGNQADFPLESKLGKIALSGNTRMTLPHRKQRRIQPRGISWQPEHNLIAAILMQAIWDRHHPWAWRDTRAWLAAQSPEPFGFGWCCQQLDLDPSHVQAAIVNHQPLASPRSGGSLNYPLIG